MAKITTAAVRRVDAETVELRLLGRVEYDERRLRTVTSWTDGRIDQLKVAVTGQRIRRGQAIATLYSPEVYSAHQDLIQAARQARRLGEGTATARTAAAAAFEATRQRLRLLGVPDSELGAMERADRPFRHVSIRANVAGTVIERLVDEGDYVTPGTGLYRVADLSKLWVQLDAYERDLAFVSRGQQVSLVISAFPRETFEGAIAFIDPVLDRRTRTSQIRVDVDNRDGRLQPGMFAEATISAGSGQRGLQSLVIPESAPLFTGRRSVVYVEVPGREEPTYEARQVRLGHRMGDVFPVVAGLSEGERVVVHGAFALDADLQIRGGRSMMAQPDDGEAGDHDLVVPVDRDFASSLAPLVGAYLSIQERLGEDDFPAAVAATRALAREVSQFSEPREREAREVWATLAEGFRRHAGQGAQAGDIEAARLVFEQLSLLMVSLLERFGNPLSTPLRLAYCPMVRQNQGASWVQRGQEVDNSYFGASMRRCGEIRATVAPGQHLLPQGGARGGEHQR
jgi:Cu(I)/Ag(I) efflux system membrane fusion protein